MQPLHFHRLHPKSASAAVMPAQAGAGGTRLGPQVLRNSEETLWRSAGDRDGSASRALHAACASSCGARSAHRHAMHA